MISRPKRLAIAAFVPFIALWLAAWFDRCVIDALVDFCGRLPSTLGGALRPAQNGMLQCYALAMALGLLALLGVLLM